MLIFHLPVMKAPPTILPGPRGPSRGRDEIPRDPCCPDPSGDTMPAQSPIRLQRRDVLVAGAAGLLLPQWARAEDYPSRPITFICPWPAGGTADASMRAICQVASGVLKQPVTV